MKWLGVFFLPPGWDASPPPGYPPALNSPVPIYTPGWREALWECPTQCPRPGLEPGALDPETSALTMRIARLHWQIIHIKHKLYVYFVSNSKSLTFQRTAAAPPNNRTPPRTDKKITHQGVFFFWGSVWAGLAVVIICEKKITGGFSSELEILRQFRLKFVLIRLFRGVFQCASQSIEAIKAIVCNHSQSTEQNSGQNPGKKKNNWELNKFSVLNLLKYSHGISSNFELS